MRGRSRVCLGRVRVHPVKLAGVPTAEVVGGARQGLGFAQPSVKRVCWRWQRLPGAAWLRVCGAVAVGLPTVTALLLHVVTGEGHR